ncbi:uncharacterized protein [Leptinotarsa decemlineata]|uniref:uncharacterized protein n=1 Tax=Leptinotarsa decemlineata TaxID=7539 RepID=UPI003D30AAB9
MSEIKLTGEEDELLIDLVAKNPPLFDPQVESYKDVTVRENIWKDIAGKMNRADVDCKRRWKYIRDSYNRFKRKRKMTSGSAAPAKNSKWELFERLQFLELVSTERASASNVSFETVVSSPMPNEEAEILFDIEKNQDIATKPAAKSTQKRKKVEDEFLTYLKKRDDQRQVYFQEMNAFKEIDDDVNTFGNHVKSVMRTLNQRFQIQARNEIFNILTKYEHMQMDLECNIEQRLQSDGHVSAVSPSGSSTATSSSNVTSQHHEDYFNSLLPL